MKRIFILFGVLALAIGVNAQNYQHSNYIGLNINGGLNTMTYNPAMGDAKLGLGFGAGLRYTHFFGTHFGIGLGVQFTQANASALYDTLEVSMGLRHNDNSNLTYDLITGYTDWRERQTITYLSVPVELYWRAPISERAFVLIGVGAQLDLPLDAKYKANEGSYDNRGQFYVNGTPLAYHVEDLPNHGFTTYDADFESKVDINKKGVSVIADLGLNFALSNNWGLYVGLYGGYGITNLLDSVSTSPMQQIDENDATKLVYNGTFASNQIDALHLLNAGLKLGINFGWDCHAKDRNGKDGGDDSDLTAYDNGNDKQKKDALDRAKDDSSKQAVANEKQRQETLRDAKDEKDIIDNDKNAVLDNAKDEAAAKAAAEEKARQDALRDTKDEKNVIDNGKDAALDNAKDEAAAKAAAEEKARQDALNRAKNDAANMGAYGNDYDSESPEEAAAREARCNARRMNNPDMAQAMSSIDADIDEAEQAANASGSEAAKSAVADARAIAADAKAAHKNGKYCRAYDLLNDAYGRIADSYAADADSYAAKANTNEAKKAADDAALYAEAAHKDGLDCAMAASRNARINSEIARDGEDGGKKSSAWDDPNYADYLAQEALDMAEDAGSKAGKTDAKDASGKAYRGKLADSYAASAKSFASSALAYSGKTNNPDAKAAAQEAQRYAAEAAEAARMGDTAAAYRAARAAQQAAERARRLANGDTGADNAGGKPASNNGNAAPADRAQLQQYLDEINATVHFDFSSTDPKIDSKTDMAIRALCLAMKADNNVKILITGHTDNIGSAEGNMGYGKRRAEALKQYMVNLGAPAANISTATKGQNEPVVENDTEEHRYQNRRAVVTLR